MNNKIVKIEMTTDENGDVAVAIKRQHNYLEYAEGQFTNWGIYKYYSFISTPARRLEVVKKIHAAQLALFLQSTPTPLPVDDGMSITFAAGSVEYTDNLETPQVDENGDLYY